MASYTIRVEEDGGERRWARAEVGEACTLGELHAWIQGVFGLGPSPWSFTRADRRPGVDASYMGPGDDWERPGEEVGIGALALRPGARWMHRSPAAPFRLREIQIEALVEGDRDGVRELERGARGRSGGFDAERMAARQLQAARDWQGELEAEATPGADVLGERAALALEVAGWIGRDADRQGVLESLDDGDGLLWMLDLPSALSEAGLHERALELCEALAFVRGEQETRAERPFLLARAGRADAARAEAERWLAEAPDDAWAWLFTSDLFGTLGESRRASEGLERAAELGDDDLDLQVAVLERRLALARSSGDGQAAARLESELEDLQLALEERADEELAGELLQGAEDEDFESERVGRNEACPCGSGMKYKRCCGAASPAPRGDAALVVELLEELAREADQPKVARALREALPRFAGEGLAGLPLGEAFPLLPRDDLPEALVHWAVLDCDLGDGTRVIERVLKRRKRIGARERELFARLTDSVPGAWLVERLAGGRSARLTDQLDAAAPPRVLREVPDLPDGAILCARLLSIDGEPALGPGTIVLEGEPAQRWLALVRARLSELRAAEPASEWPDFLRRHAHELYRPLAQA